MDTVLFSLLTGALGLAGGGALGWFLARRQQGRPRFPEARYPGEAYPTLEQVHLWAVQYLAKVPQHDQARVADVVLRGVLLGMEQHFWPHWTGERGAVRRNAYSLVRTTASMMLPVLGGSEVRAEFPKGQQVFLQRVNAQENGLLQMPSRPGYSEGVYELVDPPQG